MRRIMLLMFVCLLMGTGCAKKVNKEWAATGGSRADAVVELSVAYTALEIPITNDALGLELAKKRCATWGYSGAEPFGGVTNKCNGPIDAWTGKCTDYLAVKSYQCTGKGDETSTK